MNEFILENAIGCLDLDLLEWHFWKKNELINRNKRKNKFIKLYALAACFCFAIIAAVILMPYINTNTNTGEFHAYLGETQKSDIAEITFCDLDMENCICYFTLIKKDDTPFYFRFVGNTFDEWIDDQGNRCHQLQMYDVITPYKKYRPEHGYKVLDDLLVITVNENVVNSIPCEPGEYQISIDFSEMYNVLDNVHEVVYISHFYKFVFRTFESSHPEISRTTDWRSILLT